MLVLSCASVCRLDVTTGRAYIKYRDHELVVDTLLLGTTIPLKMGSDYMFIGEIHKEVNIFNIHLILKHNFISTLFRHVAGWYYLTSVESRT